MMAHGGLGHLYLAQGDLAHAIQVLEQGLALCRAAGIPGLGRAVIMGDLGYAYALQGRVAEGCALLEEAQGRRSAWAQMVSGALGRLAERGCQSGGTPWRRPGSTRRQRTLDLARRARNAGTRRTRCTAWRRPAQPIPPSSTQAEAHYQQALALAEGTGHVSAAGPLPPGPWHPVCADWSVGAGPDRTGRQR